MTLRQRLGNWLLPDYAGLREDLRRSRATSDRQQRRINDLEDAVLKINPTRPEGGLPDGRIMERHVYRGGHVQDTAITGQRVFFPATGVEARVDKAGVLTLADPDGNLLEIAPDVVPDCLAISIRGPR